jgi:large-conductance mechanosensitive channel
VALLAEFREFILRGNMVDLAVAVGVGTALTGVVTRRCAFCTAHLRAA